MSFGIYSYKTGKYWNQNFLTNLQNIIKFWFLPFVCDPTLFPGKISPNISNSNCVFPGKGRGDRALILTYLHNPAAEVFPHYCLSFSILAIFREKREVKVRLEVQTLGPFLFLWKLESFRVFSNNVFIC